MLTCLAMVYSKIFIFYCYLQCFWRFRVLVPLHAEPPSSCTITCLFYWKRYTKASSNRCLQLLMLMCFLSLLFTPISVAQQPLKISQNRCQNIEIVHQKISLWKFEFKCCLRPENGSQNVSSMGGSPQKIRFRCVKHASGGLLCSLVLLWRRFGLRFRAVLASFFCYLRSFCIFSRTYALATSWIVVLVVFAAHMS